MWHIHKYETKIRERTPIIVTFFGRESHQMGLKTLEQCSKCEKVKAYLIDGDGDVRQKLSDVLFTKEEIESALASF